MATKQKDEDFSEEESDDWGSDEDLEDDSDFEDDSGDDDY